MLGYKNIKELLEKLQEIGFKISNEFKNGETLFFNHKKYGEIYFYDNGIRLTFQQKVSNNSCNYKLFYHLPAPAPNLENDVLDFAKLIANNSILTDEYGEPWK